MRLPIRNHFTYCVLVFIALFLSACAANQPTTLEAVEGPLKLAWKFETGAAINHPPLILGDMVIAVPENGPLLSIALKTGAPVWQYDPPEGIWDRAYASDGRNIYVGVKGGRLAALDVEDGGVLWIQDLGINTQVPSLAVNGRLYVPTTFVGPELTPIVNGKARLFILEASTGQQIWSFVSGNYILQTPALLNDRLYLAGNFYDPQPVDEGGHTRIYAMDSQDGSLHWTYESEDGFPKQLYATDNTLVFIAYQDFANGVDVASGDLRWRKDTGNWVPSFLGAGQAIYFGSANTIVHSLDADSGDTIWDYNIPTGTFNYVLGAPVIKENELIFLTQQGDIMALNAMDGSQVWEFSTQIHSRTGLNVAGNWLTVGDSAGDLYAYQINR